MGTAHRRYLATEMTVAAVISAVLSIVFVVLVFGGRDMVPVWGAGGLVVDALPQSAMIALMSALVPTLLTRRRMRAGAVMPRAGRRWSPRHAVGRALVIAAAATLLAGIAHTALLPLGPARWPFVAVLAYKPIYGALLGGAVAWCAVMVALADPVGSAPAGSGVATGPRGG